MDFFTGKLVDIAIAGVMKVAPKLVPASLRAQIRDRLDDVNPWNDVKTNHDLVRAVRLAWIAASRRVLKAAREEARNDPALPERERKAVVVFADAARARLIPPRDLMRRRELPVGPSPIDASVGLVLAGTPEFVDATGGPPDETAIAAAFVPVLAATIQLGEADVPPRVAVLAGQGIGDPPHSFASLVFAEFAELIKDGRYPQATEAFRIHLWNRVMAAVGDVGAAVREAAVKLPAMEAMLAGAGASLARIEQAQEQHGEALEDIRAQQAAAKRRLDQILALVLDGGQIADADRERLKQEIESAQRAGGIEDKAIEALLRKLVESATPLESLAGEMKTALSGLRDLVGQVQQPHNLESRYEEMRLRAVSILKNGDLDGADAEFADLDDALDAAHRTGAGGAAAGRRSRAAVKADRARVAIARVQYRDAASLFAQAAAIAADIKAESWRYRIDEADALLRHGDEFDDDVSLEEALAVLKAALALLPAEQNPERWAETRLQVARGLLLQGSRRQDFFQLNKAAEAFFEVWTKTGSVLLSRRSHLGRIVAFREIGVAEGKRGWGPLRSAKAQYDDIFRDLTSEDLDPFVLAELQFDRAATLLHFGKLEEDDAMLAAAQDSCSTARTAFVPLSRTKAALAAILEAEIIHARSHDRQTLLSAIELLRSAWVDLPSDRMMFERRHMHLVWGMIEQRVAALETHGEAYRPDNPGNGRAKAIDGRLRSALEHYRWAEDLSRTGRPQEALQARMGEVYLDLVEFGVTSDGEKVVYLEAGIKNLKAAAEGYHERGWRDEVGSLQARIADAKRLLPG